MSPQREGEKPMNRTAIIRKLTRLQRCPKCRHIKEVPRCDCTDAHCVCNPANR